MAIALVASRGCSAAAPAAGWTERTENCSEWGYAETHVSDKLIPTTGAVGNVYPTTAIAAWDATQMIALKPGVITSPATVTTTTQYTYSGDGDSAEVILDGNGAVVDKTIALIGGVMH